MSSGPRVNQLETLVEAAMRVGAGGVSVADIQQAKAFSHFKPGAVVTLQRDRATQYVVQNVQPHAGGVPMATIKRLVPKLSKAERKREKKARRRRGPACL